MDSFKQVVAASDVGGRPVDGRDTPRERRDRARGGLDRWEIPPEIAFLSSQGVKPGVLLQASRIAYRCGATADEALLGERLIAQGVYYRALARHLRVPFFDGQIEFDDALDPTRAVTSGIAPLKANGLGVRAAVAPRGASIRFLLAAAKQGRPLSGLALTSPQRLGELVRERAGAKVAQAAAGDLKRDDPSLSACSGLSWPQMACAGAVILVVAALAPVAPGGLEAAASILLWAIFAAWIVVRNLAVAAAADGGEAFELPADEELPVYSIVAPLHREANMVAKLVGAFEALDYPVLGSKLT